MCILNVFFPVVMLDKKTCYRGEIAKKNINDQCMKNDYRQWFVCSVLPYTQEQSRDTHYNRALASVILHTYNLKYAKIIHYKIWPLFRILNLCPGSKNKGLLCKSNNMKIMYYKTSEVCMFAFIQKVHVFGI